MIKLLARLLVCVVITTQFAHAESTSSPIPAEHFSRFAEFHSVRLSPSGEHIAVTVPRDDTTGLVVLDANTLQVVSAGNLDSDMHVIDARWVSDERLVSSVGYQEYWSMQPLWRGELVSFSAEGGELRYLIGYRGRDSFSKIPSNKFLGFARLNNSLASDPDNILISACAWASGELCHWSLYQLHAESGRRKRIIRAPQLGNGDFVTDREGNIRFYVGESENLVGSRFYAFEAEERTWRHVDFERYTNAVPVAYDGVHDRLYLIATEQERTRCLYQTSSDLTALEEIACHETVDIHAIDFNAQRTRPLRVHFQNGHFESINVAPDLEEARLLEAISSRFPGQLVRISSWSEDGNQFVFRVASDRNPGEYFLFDREKRRARYLFAERSWIDPAAMAERRPISYEARDGNTIHGYLTVPPASEAPWPLIVHPHGGPFGIQDGWTWDATPQFLASRGYAVLQMNFRGSGGYGARFHDAGIREWGTGMIDDILDGTRWAIDSGFAAEDNICIFGSSYGGFSSLMSAVRAPDLFRCVVTNAGVYDLRSWTRTSDVGSFSRGRNYIDDYVGTSEEELLKHSPITYIDQLKAPVLIAHGKNDARTPYKDAKALRHALKKRDIPYEWFVRDREGHGFFSQENRLEFLHALESFLDSHLQPAE